VAETGSTYAGNAGLKADSACRHTGLAALADDTGLEVDALEGAPGVVSGRYAGPEQDPRANVARLLRALQGVPDAGRTARFRCVLALAEPAGGGPGTAPGVAFYEGVVEGTITREPRGNSGFGYDPVFLVSGTGRTMAELSFAEKNRLSHRGRALALLRDALEKRRP
jgi:XTP/dITP diphosphohydrolase